MKEHLIQLAERIDAYSLRERVLLAAALVFVLLFAWQEILLKPLNQRRDTLGGELEQAQQRIARLDEQMRAIAERQNLDPNRQIRQRLSQLERQQVRVDRELTGMTASLIPPEDMAEVLEELLTQETRLRLVRVESLGSEPLLEVAAEDGAADDPVAGGLGVYQHSMAVEFEGIYLETLEYMRILEALPWTFYWDSVRFETQGYPRAKVRMTVKTLSLHEGWIGV